MTIAFCALISIQVGQALAESQSVQIQAGKGKSLAISLEQGDTIQFSFSVQGGIRNDINFIIEDPNSAVLSNIRVGPLYTSELQINISGNYTFTFDNSFSTISSKSVQFNYQVIHPPPPVIPNTVNLASYLIWGALMIIGIIVGVLSMKLHHWRERRSKISRQVMQNEDKFYSRQQYKSSPPNYYEILGVERDASKEDIQTTFRKQILKWHSDKNRSQKDIDEFTKILYEARDVLLDDAKRRQYDKIL